MPKNTKDYAQLAEQKKKDLKNKRKSIAEDKMFTGKEMFNAYVAITAVNPFTDNPHINNSGRVIGPHIGSKNYPNAHSFSAKLNKNKKELNDNLQATSAVFPELNEDQKKDQKRYKESEKEITQSNAGIEDLEKFYQENKSRLSNIDSIIEMKIEAADNLSIYQQEIAKLEEKYKDLLKTIENIEKEKNEIMGKRLLKSNFDMITEQEIINSGISQQAQEWIDIMIAF